MEKVDIKYKKIALETDLMAQTNFPFDFTATDIKIYVEANTYIFLSSVSCRNK